ncbi:MAG: YaiO family outer membrane beta-barrel protein [Vulcanimicrobiaceae bacterium]
MRRVAFAVAIVLAFVCFAASMAYADDPPAATVDVSATTLVFSPQATYGPWQFDTVAYRAVSGNDKPGLSFTARSDRNGPSLDNGRFYVLDDYHQLSGRAFLYGAVQIGDGNVFPSTGAFLEGDMSVAPRFAVGAGGGMYHYANGLMQRYLSVGPTYYFPHGTATVRYLPIWTQGQVAASAILANVSVGDPGRTVTSLTVQSGVQPVFVVNDPTIASRFADRGVTVDLAIKHWMNPRLGFDVGLDYGTESDRNSGAVVYRRRGVTLGIFAGMGHAPKAP